MEPPVRIELTTFRLQGGCSTTELGRRCCGRNYGKSRSNSEIVSVTGQAWKVFVTNGHSNTSNYQIATKTSWLEKGMMKKVTLAAAIAAIALVTPSTASAAEINLLAPKSTVKVATKSTIKTLAKVAVKKAVIKKVENKVAPKTVSKVMVPRVINLTVGTSRDRKSTRLNSSH